eukprot:8940739-Alexandrium_andersonii.AAC.1
MCIRDSAERGSGAERLTGTLELTRSRPEAGRVTARWVRSRGPRDREASVAGALLAGASPWSIMPAVC